MVELGLVPAVERLVDEIRQTGMRTVEFMAQGLNGLRLDADLETTAFRIVQEALSNSVQHSSATQLRVSLAVRKDELKIKVADNGKGFDVGTIVLAHLPLLIRSANDG